MARFQCPSPRRLIQCAEVEYSMVVQQLKSSTYYQRFGIAVQRRDFELGGNLQKPQIWDERPSLYEEGGVHETVTII